MLTLLNFYIEPCNTNLNKKISQTIGAKVYSQEGNSPDCILKCANITKIKNVILIIAVRGQLGSSYPLKKA